LRASQTAQAAILTTQLQSQAVLIQQLSNQLQHPTLNNRSLIQSTTTIEGSAIELANELYENRSNNHKSNFVHVDRIFNEHSIFLEPLMTACPQIKIIISHILTNNFGWSVKSVDTTTPMIHFTEEDCQRIATALALFLRKRKTAEVALEAWKLNYPQLKELSDVEFFNSFMLVIAQNLVRDSMWGVVYRVSVGVAFSTTDAATDMYTILVYKAAGLTGRATALACMMGLNMLLQLGLVWFQYRKKPRKKRLYECAICLVFLRPAVDAYRVATNHVDKDLMFDPLVEMMCNKLAELFCESIPGCVLQCYVLLENPELISVGAVASLLISATTTGFTSSMLTFDMDVDSAHRQNQPAFYG